MTLHAARGPWLSPCGRRDGIHRRRDERDVEIHAAREACPHVGVLGVYGGETRRQQDVVEGQAFTDGLHGRALIMGAKRGLS